MQRTVCLLERTSQQRGVCLPCGRRVGADAHRIAASTRSSFACRLSCSRIVLARLPSWPWSRTVPATLSLAGQEAALYRNRPANASVSTGADSRSSISQNKRFRRIEARWWKVSHVYRSDFSRLSTKGGKRFPTLDVHTFSDVVEPSSLIPRSLKIGEMRYAITKLSSSGSV